MANDLLFMQTAYSLKCTYRDLPNGRAARRERGLGTIGSALKCTTNQQKPCLIRPIQSKSQDPISARDVDLTNDATGQLARSGQAGIGSLTPSERDTQHEMARAWSIDGSVEVPIGEGMQYHFELYRDIFTDFLLFARIS